MFKPMISNLNFNQFPDSGGPLTCDGKLVGLASFGVRCGSYENFPGVFVDVFFYRDWIEANWSSGIRIYSLRALVAFGALVNIFARFCSNA